MPFADLHCHPSFWSFNQIRNSDTDQPTHPDNHIWNIYLDQKQLRNKKKGLRATYSQSDFATLSKGDVRLVFASLYSIEKGFFMGNADKGWDANVVGGVLNQLLLNWPGFFRKIAIFLLSPFNKLLSIVVNNKGWGRDIIQKWIMCFSIKRINFFQNEAYDYFEELQKEYAFYKKSELSSPLPPAPSSTKKYKIVTNSQELISIINSTDQIAVVFSIEGFHCLTLVKDPNSDDFLKLADDATIAERINLIKNDWKLFFITFSHHFSNHLAGHAHSLPKLLMEIANPEPLMNEGLLPDGEKYIRKLLSITPSNDNDAAEGRRVLIDVKHFSARSRRDYYNNIIRPYNQKFPNNKIPVIASHCGYYGQLQNGNNINLSYLIANMDKEEDDSFENGFYKWNINLCDEDIQVIVESEGLIGLSFDQRIMGEKNVTNVSAEYWVNTVGKCIIAMISSAIGLVNIQPERMWETLCIGTDFDGLIDPLNAFSTAEQFNVFKSELLRFLTVLSIRHGDYLFLNNNPYSPAKVVDMICFENAYNFTVKHFK